MASRIRQCELYTSFNNCSQAYVNNGADGIVSETLRVFSCMLGHFYGADFEVIWVSGQAKNVCVSWPKCEEPTDERHMTLLHYRRLQLTPEV